MLTSDKRHLSGVTPVVFAINRDTRFPGLSHAARNRSIIH